MMRLQGEIKFRDVVVMYWEADCETDEEFPGLQAWNCIAHRLVPEHEDREFVVMVDSGSDTGHVAARIVSSATEAFRE